MTSIANIIIAILITLLIIGLVRMLYNSSCDSDDNNEKQQHIVILNYNTNLYDKETQKNIEQTFFDLVLIKQILDNGNDETKSLLIPPLLTSLASAVTKVMPLLDYEKEISASLKNTTFKLKKDGIGNICFGSPHYFMCFNPKTKDLFPYTNDMMIVYHIMLKKAMGINRFVNVEKVIDSILRNVIGNCNKEGEAFYIDYTTKFDDTVLTKLFNSKLDTEILSSLMMMVLFMNRSKLLDEVIGMNDDGSFMVSEGLRGFLQKFYPHRLHSDIPYSAMKHALFNISYNKYTLEGYSMIVKDQEKIDAKQKFIEENMAKSLCAVKKSSELKSILKSDNVSSTDQPKKEVTFAVTA